MSRTEQVVIVGSGMCGMVTALALARRGRDIRVIERDPPLRGQQSGGTATAGPSGVGG